MSKSDTTARTVRKAMRWGSMSNSSANLFRVRTPGSASPSMKAEQSIRGSEYVPMPNSQGYNVSLFFQDYFPGYKRVKLNLKGVLSGGLPVTAPRTGYEDGYFRTPTYKRVDLGFSYQLAGGTDAIMDRGFFRNLKNIWLGLDIFNLFDIKNTSSYYWITNIDNHQYAIPNYLTGRQLNIRLIVDF